MSGVKTELQAIVGTTILEGGYVVYATILKNLQIPLHISTETLKFFEHITSQIVLIPALSTGILFLIWNSSDERKKHDGKRLTENPIAILADIARILTPIALYSQFLHVFSKSLSPDQLTNYSAYFILFTVVAYQIAVNTVHRYKSEARKIPGSNIDVGAEAYEKQIAKLESELGEVQAELESMFTLDKDRDGVADYTQAEHINTMRRYDTLRLREKELIALLPGARTALVDYHNAK